MKKEIQIAYIGGGSRGWAWGLMGDLAQDKQLCGCVRLYDIDMQAARANETIGNSLSPPAGAAAPWRYKAMDSLQSALTGADFVVISILPGTFDEMAVDLGLPEKYGIYQSVGDTVGPGGIVRGMRTVPMYVEIAEAIKQYAPQAWVINYTNPMSVCTSTLYRIFPAVKAFGCCHEVFSSQRLLAKMLVSEYGIPGVTRNDIQLNVMGINHFTWFDTAHYQDTDLMPLYTRFVEKYAESGYAASEEDADDTNTFRNRNKVSFDLFRRYGVVPVAGDRHIAEFMPPYYLKSPQEIETRWGFALTPVANRRKSLEKRLQASADYCSGKKKFAPEPSGEEGVLQIRALLGLGDMLTNVNLPNRGQMEDLPAGAVVETNALISRDSVRPLFAGRLPGTVNTIVARHAANQETLVTAGIHKDIELAYSVFINDCQMNLALNDSRRLFRDMVRGTAAYLQGWDIEALG